MRSSLGPVPDVAHPDVSGLVAQMLDLQPTWVLPDSDRDFRYSIRPFRPDDPLTRTFLSAGHRPYLAQAQGRHPHALFVDSGVVRLRELAGVASEAIAVLGDGRFVLSLPLVVQPAATLIVDGSEVLLDQQAGAFLVNGGRLLANDAVFAGVATRSGEHPAVYRSRGAFRPFIVAWGRSVTRVANSRFAHLGFQQSKAYGLTISDFHHYRKGDRRVRPTAWLQNNDFEDLYFGVYTFEAGHTVIYGNRFRNCIVYGIDPHDRSMDLWIVENRVTGTLEKHGIILSREVDAARVIGNDSSGNAGAGIMLDRSSRSVLLARNRTQRNGSDGLAVYESDAAHVVDHVSADNAKHGIYVRNSSDVVVVSTSLVNNGRFGIAGASVDLDRKSDRDPYRRQHSFRVIDSRFDGNRSGMISSKGATRVGLFRIHYANQKLRLGGDLAGVAASVGRTISTERRLMTLIEPVR